MQKPLLSKAAAQLARGLDRAFNNTALNPPRSFLRSHAESLGHEARMRSLRALATFYDRPEFLTQYNACFPKPGPIAPRVIRVRGFGAGGEVLDLHWPSEFEPLWSNAGLAARLDGVGSAVDEHARLSDLANARELARELGFDRKAELREKYLRLTKNRTARARWFRHNDGLRPCVVLIHGYMGGSYVVEERVWQVKRLFQSGLDVVLTVLPFHGLRRSEKRGYLPPSFPSSDPRFTIEGYRQLVMDHRALFDYLRDGRVSGLGLMGMSLGGNAAALLATLENDLRFLVLYVPLASIEEFAYRHGRMVGSPQEQAAQRDALIVAQRVISPMSRPPLVSGDRVIVVAGESDLVTGVGDAKRMAAHFGAELSLFEGGHLLHFGRERAFAPVWRLLQQCAEVSP